MKIPISKPLFDEDEMNSVLEPIKDGWVSQGSRVQEFENVFKAYVCSQYASAVSSGTAAIHVALLASGIGSGDEVITSPFTCVASANPIEYVGARPIFMDIDIETYNLDSSQIERAITKQTKAIMPVHLFGLCTNMDAVLKIAQKHGLKVVEDAALGLGAFYKDKHAGTFGEVGCFSFHPRKMITTGEGGMLVANNKEIDLKSKALRNYGASVSAWQRHQSKLHILSDYPFLGFNYKMTDIQASLGIMQMRKLGTILEKRRQIAKRYDQGLSSIDWLICPVEPAGYKHSYQSYVCLFNPYDVVHNPAKMDWAARKRTELMEWLADKGIATVAGAQALHTVSYYKKKYGFNMDDFPKALKADLLSIALPIFPQLTIEEQEYIIDCLKLFSDRLHTG